MTTVFLHLISHPFFQQIWLEKGVRNRGRNDDIYMKGCLKLCKTLTFKINLAP